MTLDIDSFRPEKGGNPDKVRENQKRRFADPALVDKVVNSDEAWRQGESICQARVQQASQSKSMKTNTVYSRLCGK